MDIEAIKRRTAEIEALSREERIALREERLRKNRLIGDYAMPCTLPANERPTVRWALEAKQKLESGGTKIKNVGRYCPNFVSTPRKTKRKPAPTGAAK
jgi:hypothetical protein